jgi:hypothetical protein
MRLVLCNRGTLGKGTLCTYPPSRVPTGDGDGAKDMAAHATTGERGVMVGMGHGLCVFLCV